MTGLEPATAWSQTRNATNCATPRKNRPADRLLQSARAKVVLSFCSAKFSFSFFPKTFLPGNCLPIANIPVGEMIHCIELYPGKGAQLVRAAGDAAQLMAKENGMAQVRLPSGEVRYVREECKATIGQVGNTDWANIQIGKAGRKRHMGWRPTVRGSVMNPNDHPHGGGEGKCGIGRPGPCTPWGKPALGLKTRKKNKQSNKLIVRRRDGRTIK